MDIYVCVVVGKTVDLMLVELNVSVDEYEIGPWGTFIGLK